MAVVLLAASVLPAGAHPAPFSYVDVRIEANAPVINVTVAAHIFDLAHDLGIEPPERLLDAAFLNEKAAAISTLLQNRLTISADGDTLEAGPWSAPEIVRDQQLIRMRARYDLHATAGGVVVTARLFPYDLAHQTFVNVYEGDTLVSQQILDVGRTRFEHFTDTRRGVEALVRRFTGAGFQRILSGSDHVLFVVGLLLLGGTFSRLLGIIAAYALSESVALTLATLSTFSTGSMFNPPARIIAPAVALSVVYIGVDNLMIRGGRDTRLSIALVFGLVHGFALASVLGAMDRPGGRRVWSLAAFDAGTALGALFIVAAIVSLLSAVRAQSEGAGRRIATAGSALVAAAGAFLFVQRLFFPGGI